MTKFIIIFSMLISFNSFSQEISDIEKASIIEGISNSFSELLSHNSNDQFGENVDCKIQRTRNSLEEASFLWSDLAEINEDLVNKSFYNFDRFLSFIKYLDSNNDPSFLGGTIYILNAFAQLAVENDQGETKIDSETIAALLEIVQEKPFDLFVDPNIFALLSKIDYLEISTIKEGKNQGETQLVVRNKNGEKIRSEIADLVGYEVPYVQKLTINDGARFIFIDGQSRRGDQFKLDEQAIKKKNKEIKSLISKVSSKSDEEIEENIKKNIESKLDLLKTNSDANPDKTHNFLKTSFFSYYNLGANASTLENSYGDIKQEVDSHSPNNNFPSKLAKYISGDESSLVEIEGYLASSPYKEAYIGEVKRIKESAINTINSEARRKQSIGFTDEDKGKIINFVDSQSNEQAAPPLYFEIEGIKAGLKFGIVKIGAEVSKGALVPGARIDGKQTNSVFVKGNGTGAAGLVKKYLAL